MTRFPTAVLAAVLVAGGCSSALLTDRGADPDELADIKNRIVELQRTAAMTQVEVDRLRRELAKLEARVNGPGAPVEERPSAPAPAAASSVEPPADPSAARPNESMIEVSDLEPRLQPASPPAAALPDPSLPDEPPPAVAVPAPSAALPPAARARPGQPVTEAAQALYDRGYTLYHQGRHVDAESSFRRFLQAYPDSPLSDNAQYWVGESRFARGDLEGALAAFHETSERYPSGNKVADSLLKAADCLRGLGDESRARAGYEEVIRRFPGTAAAAMAEERRAGGNGP